MHISRLDATPVVNIINCKKSKKSLAYMMSLFLTFLLLLLRHASEGISGGEYIELSHLQHKIKAT